ncbi:serine/threonine protein kinase [Methylocucumis oryzae]|uniref:serine/threonine protein kinase n=1 Tax=Methylocucumis oryzae TaxID=1632867 RepID=UPI000A6D1F7F|nr:serine/threonine protein kinase [Methylocucumis oryzae]
MLFFPSKSGRVPEIQDYETFEWLGRLIGRLHAVGALRAYQARPTLSIENFGVEPSTYLLEHNIIPPELVDAYQTTVNQALAQIQRCYQQAGDSQYLRLHGDCYPGNMLWHDDGPHFVDFDDSRMGPAVQDLWLILNGSRQERLLQLDALLQGYTTFYDFDHRELYLIEALRTLRLIHYSAWLARRWNDPAFPNAFPWFNTLDYWQKRIEELAEQIELMQEQPLMTMIVP